MRQIILCIVVAILACGSGGATVSQAPLPPKRVAVGITIITATSPEIGPAESTNFKARYWYNLGPTPCRVASYNEGEEEMYRIICDGVSEPTRGRLKDVPLGFAVLIYEPLE
jgi:hypothetical protein